MTDCGGSWQQHSQGRSRSCAAYVASAALACLGLACNALLGIADGAGTGAGISDAALEGGLEAGADAASDAGGPFCVSQQPPFVFCADFDEDAGLGDWGPLLPIAHGGGSVAASSMDYQSPPQSFQGVANAHGIADQSGAYVQQPIGSKSDHMACDLDVRVDTLFSRSAQIFDIVLYDGPVYYVDVAFNLSYDATSTTTWANIIEADLTGTALYVGVNEVAIDPSVWHHVSLRYASTPTPTYTLVVDTQSPINQPAMYATQFASAKSVEVAVGARSYDSTQAVPAWTTYVDNIVCR